LHVPEIPTLFSLGVIIVTLLVTVAASLMKANEAGASKDR
jgi:hypothetical protein